MTSTPEESSESEVAAVSFEELADLQAGLLEPHQEERLRMLMDRDPDRTAAMIRALERVDLVFPDPEGLAAPDVPPLVAARWQSAIAQEAERRASGSADHGAPVPRLPDDLG